MSSLLFFGGFIGFVVSMVMLIYRIIKKRDTKKPSLALVIFLVLFAIGITGLSKESNSKLKDENPKEYIKEIVEKETNSAKKFDLKDLVINDDMSQGVKEDGTAISGEYIVLIYLDCKGEGNRDLESPALKYSRQIFNELQDVKEVKEVAIFYQNTKDDVNAKISAERKGDKLERTDRIGI